MHVVDSCVGYTEKAPKKDSCVGSMLGSTLHRCYHVVSYCTARCNTESSCNSICSKVNAVEVRRWGGEGVEDLGGREGFARTGAGRGGRGEVKIAGRGLTQCAVDHALVVAGPVPALRMARTRQDGVSDWNIQYCNLNDHTSVCSCGGPPASPHAHGRAGAL